MTRKTYTVRAKRWQNGWELHIDGPDYEGVTQSYGLKSAERMARDYIALDLEVPEDSFDIVIIPEVGGFLGDLLKDAKTAIAAAQDALADAAEKSRKAVSSLKADGMTQVEIAQVLRISQQRVSQLLSEAAEQARPRSRGKVHHG